MPTAPDADAFRRRADLSYLNKKNTAYVSNPIAINNVL